MNWFQSQSVVLQAFLAGLFTWGCTIVGSAIVFFFKHISRKLLDIMMGFAAGVMIAASFWSLLQPSIEYAETSYGSLAWLPAAIGFLAGGFFLRLIDAINYESLRGGHTVFFGKFYTNFGIAAAAQRIAEAVINDSHEEMPVSNYRPEYGTYLGYPAIVGRKGILERLDLHLTEEEKEKLLHSAETIKENTQKGLEHA